MGASRERSARSVLHPKLPCNSMSELKVLSPSRLPRVVVEVLVAAWVVAALLGATYYTAHSVQFASQVASIVSGGFRSVLAQKSAEQVASKRVSSYPIRRRDGSVGRLSLQGREALLLIYRSDCNTCKTSMARWLELLAAARVRNIAVFALGTEADSNRLSTWSGLEGVVDVIALPSPSDLKELTGADAVRATAIVQNDVVTTLFPGTPGPWRQRYILHKLSENR